MLLLFGIGDERGLHFLQRSQDDLLITRQRLPLEGILHLDVRLNPAGVEYGPAYSRTDRPEAIGPVAEGAELLALEAERAGQREFGEQIRRRHADARRGSVKLRFGSANIR